MKTADKEKRSVIPEKRQRKAKSKKSLVANSYNSRLPLMNEPIGMTDLFPKENSPEIHQYSQKTVEQYVISSGERMSKTEVEKSFKFLLSIKDLSARFARSR